MKYIILSLLIVFCLSGCAHTACVKLPRPLYPTMNTIRVQKDGAIDAENRKKVVGNLLNLSKLIDELYLCPCWKEE